MVVSCLYIAPASEADRKDLKAWEERAGVNLDDNDTIFGWDPTEPPCAVLESDPGDIVLFSQYIFHAAFGGWDGRRMVNTVWLTKPALNDSVQEREWGDMPRNMHELRKELSRR